MRALRIATYSEREACYAPLAELYQRTSLDEFVGLVREYPDAVVYDQPEEQEIDESVETVVCDNDRYIMTTTDGMGCDAVNIYERPSVYDLLPF